MADAPISVFISYSRKDSAFVDRLEADLKAYGFDTWVDRGHLEGGDDWARKIEQRIEDHEAFVVALSPDANISVWVRREIIFAQNAGRHIIPVIVSSVTTTPIEIIEKQRIDLSASYADGLQDLRIALLKTRDLPAPPKPAQAPQPLLAPDLGDPVKGLVQIPPAQSPLNPDLSSIFMQARSALAHGSLDLAEALLRQIVEIAPNFGHGLAAEDLDRVRKQLEPIQIDRLQHLASDAHLRGAWGEEIGALHALVDRKPDDDVIRDRLEVAEQCQKWSFLYDYARSAAQRGDISAVSENLTSLWTKVPAYGDPARIAPPGQKLPAPGATPSAQRYAPLAQGHTILMFTTHTGQASALRWSLDGSRLATAGADGLAHIWNPHDGKDLLAYRGHTYPLTGIAWLPDGRVVSCAAGDGTVRIWQARDGKVIFAFDVEAKAYMRVDASPGSIVASGYTSYSAGSYSFTSVWNARTGAQTVNSTERAKEQLFDVSLSPNGSWIAASSSSGFRVVSILLETQYHSDLNTRAACWSPDSGQVVLGCGDRTLRVLQSSAREWKGGVTQAFACGGHAGPVTDVSWSPDGKLLASGSSDGVRVWDALNGQLLYNYTEHGAEITAVDFSPDNARIASADVKGQVHIWKA